MNVLSTAYAGNIQYFSKLLSGEECLIEVCESYVKQSYRNRCDILSANGVISLTVPVVKKHGEKTPVKDTRIDYVMSWQKQHWRSIVSAYKNSAFFDYFEESIAPCYEIRYDFLLDFNDELMRRILMCMDASVSYARTEQYRMYGPDVRDYRNGISPKAALRVVDPAFCPVEYYQVFSDRFAFAPNLSVLDILFCEGLQAPSLIRQSVKCL